MMPTNQQQLEDETKRVLRAHGWSLRGANIATGISHSIINNMAHGLRPSSRKIVEWAKAIKEDPAFWLNIAGFDYLDGLGTPSPAEATQPAEPPVSPPSAPAQPAEASAHTSEVRPLFKRPREAQEEEPGAYVDEEGNTREPVDDEFEEIVSFWDGAPPSDRRMLLELKRTIEKVNRGEVKSAWDEEEGK